MASRARTTPTQRYTERNAHGTVHTVVSFTAGNKWSKTITITQNTPAGLVIETVTESN